MKPIIAALILFVAAASPTLAQLPATTVPATITVQGMGQASAAPDTAIVQAGVTTEALTAADAVKNNTDAVQRLFAVLSSSGIEARDQQTASFNVSPVFDRQNRDRTSPRIVGYRVSNQVRVRVRALDKLGDILDKLIVAGANQISGVSFIIGDDADLRDTARKRAIADARHRATIYAEELGVEIGAPMSVRETAAQSPRPRMFAAAESRAAVPIAAGEQQISVSVTVVYAIN